MYKLTTNLQIMKESKVIYKKLSYQIIGLSYKVHNELGGGHREKIYQKALETVFKKEKIPFISQYKVDLFYLDNKIGYYYLDFYINNKIIVEIKVGDFFKRKDIDQLYGYLKSLNLKLGIIVNFTKHKVYFRRVLNNY